MAVVFVSHSSRDDEHVNVLEQWLGANSFTDVFVDHQSIAGGDKWREALRQATNSCRVVICLVTANWLSSSECFGEFMAAWYMGRRIIPLILLPERGILEDEARTAWPGLRRRSGHRPRAMPRRQKRARFGQ